MLFEFKTIFFSKNFIAPKLDIKVRKSYLRRKKDGRKKKEKEKNGLGQKLQINRIEFF